MVYRNNAGRLCAGFISVWSKTSWLGLSGCFYVLGCYYIQVWYQGKRGRGLFKFSVEAENHFCSTNFCGQCSASRSVFICPHHIVMFNFFFDTDYSGTSPGNQCRWGVPKAEHRARKSQQFMAGLPTHFTLITLKFHRHQSKVGSRNSQGTRLLHYFQTVRFILCSMRAILLNKVSHVNVVEKILTTLVFQHCLPQVNHAVLEFRIRIIRVYVNISTKMRNVEANVATFNFCWDLGWELLCPYSSKFP